MLLSVVRLAVVQAAVAHVPATSHLSALPAAFSRVLVRKRRKRTCLSAAPLPACPASRVNSDTRQRQPQHSYLGDALRGKFDDGARKHGAERRCRQRGCAGGRWQGLAAPSEQSAQILRCFVGHRMSAVEKWSGWRVEGRVKM